MKTYKEFITELDIATLMSHSKKRIDQSVQTSQQAMQAGREGEHKKSYDLNMQAHKLGLKGYKSLDKALKKKYPNGNPANDTRGYDQPNRYHGD